MPVFDYGGAEKLEHNGVYYEVVSKKNGIVSEAEHSIIKSIIDMGLNVPRQRFLVYKNEIQLNMTFASAPFTVFKDMHFMEDEIKRKAKILADERDMLSSIEILSVDDSVGKTKNQLIDDVAFKIVDRQHANPPLRLRNPNSVYEGGPISSRNKD